MAEAASAARTAGCSRPTRRTPRCPRRASRGAEESHGCTSMSCAPDTSAYLAVTRGMLRMNLVYT